MPYAAVNGLHMYYEVHGEGPPLLLLHGGTGSINPASTVIPFFAKEFRVIAIDFCEDVPRLPGDAVERIVALMEVEGMTARISSIHVNGWFGAYDKLTMTRSLLAEAFGIDLDAERERFVFVGDSPNDAPMFAFFPHAVGVANVRDFAERIAALPAWVTRQASGAGFAELADFLLGA